MIGLGTVRMAALAAGAFGLAACGGLSGGDEFYADMEERCLAGFGEGQEENAAKFCECQEAKLREQEVSPVDLFDEAILRDIDLECSRAVTGG